MKIYLLRHGEAVHNYESDRLRPLSENGKFEIQRIGKFLKSKNVFINKIYSSPLMRAYQSADLVSKVINFGDEIIEVDFLLPEANPDEVLSFFKQVEYESVLLVTHQPLIGSLVSLLIFGRNYPLAIKKSTLICIEATQNFNSKNTILHYIINAEIL